MRFAILILFACMRSACALHAQDSCSYYRAKSDSFQRAYKNLVKLDNLRRVSAMRHAIIVSNNHDQAKFIKGWIKRDLR